MRYIVRLSCTTQLDRHPKMSEKVDLPEKRYVETFEIMLMHFGTCFWPSSGPRLQLFIFARVPLSNAVAASKCP